MFHIEVADLRKTKFKMGAEPTGLHRIAVLAQIVDHLAKIAPDKVRQHPAVVDVGAPADERLGVGLLPEARDEGAQKKLLGQAHAGVGRHFKGAHFQQAETGRRCFPAE
jgi:hypothetical protein